MPASDDCHRFTHHSVCSENLRVLMIKNQIFKFVKSARRRGAKKSNKIFWDRDFLAIQGFLI